MLIIIAQIRPGANVIFLGRESSCGERSPRSRLEMMIIPGMVTVKYKQKGGPREGKPAGRVGYSTISINTIRCKFFLKIS